MVKGDLASAACVNAGSPTPRTLWRVPTTGGAPSSTGLVMEGLRDMTLHPDGRQIAFNAGWKEYESWVLEGVVGR